MLRKLYDLTLSFAATRHAEKALAAVSFIESSVFPIPPDVLLVPMVLAARAKWLRYATLCTVASVLGGFFGYFIGAFLFDLIGQPVLEFYGLDEAFARLSRQYNSEWGKWAVVFAAATPFPYKVVTIFSGTTGLDLLTFTIASIVGRGLRFYLVAWLLERYGTPIRTFIERYLGILVTLFLVLLIGGFVALKYLM